MATVLPFSGASPEVHPGAWLASTATVIGGVRIEDRTAVLFGAVLRGDMDRIVLGPGSNLQDNAVVHTDVGLPAVIGAGVSIGHGAVVHGCTIEDDCLIGMSATVLNGAVVGAGSLVAAGAVVLEGARIPPRSLVTGVPGRVRRALDDDEVERLRENARHYRELAAAYRRQWS